MQDSIIEVFKPELLSPDIGHPDCFTGIVRISFLVQGEEPSCMTCGCINFDRSARSAWHTHPKGQLLIIMDGAGLIQEWGKSVQRVKKGDVIWTPPNVKHWHGASPESSMTHVAVQETLDEKNINWLEKVSDEQYHAGAMNLSHQL